MRIAVAALLTFALPAAAWLPQTQHGRRALIRSAASLAVPATLTLPFPAAAKSKEKAEEKAIQKATAKEARQAMKVCTCMGFQLVTACVRADGMLCGAGVQVRTPP